MKITARGLLALATCLVAGLLFGCRHRKPPDTAYSGKPDFKAVNSWNPKAAASYLDQREVWWMNWQGASRDHHTFCVSCHTQMPYALARPALGKARDVGTPSADEFSLLADVTKRVRWWNEEGPYYSDEKYGAGMTIESRGTEAVLNAFLLACYEVQTGRLPDDTRAAFDHLWALQETTGDQKGAWPWLQFYNAPWEGRNSQYYGAALAAIAAGMTPENYRSSPAIQNNLKLLREYLHREYGRQSTLNRIYLLWASAKWPGLLTEARWKSIIKEIFGEQNADGGWTLASLKGTWRFWSLHSFVGKWMRPDGTRQDLNSDGCATGLATYVLQEAGVPSDDSHLRQGLSWLVDNQNKEGFWLATSLNKQRNPSSDIGRFMSRAASAYAVLSLTKAVETKQPSVTVDR